MTWPTCDNAARLLGYDLRCTLPRGHLLDGEQMHRNDEGMEWIVTVTDEDGRERPL